MGTYWLKLNPLALLAQHMAGAKLVLSYFYPFGVGSTEGSHASPEVLCSVTDQLRFGLAEGLLQRLHVLHLGAQRSQLAMQLPDLGLLGCISLLGRALQRGHLLLGVLDSLPQGQEVLAEPGCGEKVGYELLLLFSFFICLSNSSPEGQPCNP